MSGKGRAITTKQRVMIGPDKTQMINSIRKKFRYCETVKERESGNDIGINSLIEWASHTPVVLDEEGVNAPYIVNFWKIPNEKRPTEGCLPEELTKFVKYMLIEGNVSESDVRGYTFHVLKPPETKSNTESTFDQAKMYVSDRFIYTFGSNELMKLKIIDIDRLKQYAGLGKKTPIIEVIEDQVKSGDVLHMDLQGAISTLPTVDNKTAYMRPKMLKFRDGVSVTKTPTRRYVIILDIIATTTKVQTVLSDKVSTFNEILDSKPQSQKAKIIRSFEKSFPDEAKLETVAEEAEVIPDLVEVPSTRVETEEYIIEDVNDEDEEDLEGF